MGDLSDPDTYESLKPGWMEPEDGGEGAAWEEELARRLGWVEIPFPENAPENDWPMPDEERRRIREEFEATPEYQAWSTNRGELHEIVKQHGVAIDTYGSPGYSMYCAQVKASIQWVYDWGSIELAPLVVDPVWPGLIARFVQLLELPTSSGKQPGWHMNCSYG